MVRAYASVERTLNSGVRDGDAGKSSSRRGSEAVTALGVVTAFALSALFAAFFYYLYVRYKVKEKQKKKEGSQRFIRESFARSESERRTTGMVQSPSLSCAAQVFTYRQLEAATNEFDEENVIGHGGFGSVFRGLLPDGRVAAIKQLDESSKQGDFEFRVEVDMLSKLHSPYLVGLIGYCADQDHRLLVYDYLSNGSLQEHLYKKEGSSSSCGVHAPYLDWETRMRIALDSARGLEYLHETVNPPVIHRDFKSSNILLDHNFNAKVSDFGLAKLGSDKIGGLVSTRVLGTHGYVAPEYAMTGHLTTKSDVYSYGVVLLELLTGRVPVDMNRPPGQGVLVSWALPRLTDRVKLAEMVDPRLEGRYAMKELIQVAAIAAMCVQPEADYRPLMTDVVQSLIPLVKSKSGSKISSASDSQRQVGRMNLSSKGESGSSSC